MADDNHAVPVSAVGIGDDDVTDVDVNTDVLAGAPTFTWSSTPTWKNFRTTFRTT